MQTRIQLFTLMWIRIQLLKIMGIRIRNPDGYYDTYGMSDDTGELILTFSYRIKI
jgi:hypothetical protein